MSEIIWTTSMVRAIAGWPLTILVLLLIDREPHNQSWLRRHSGFSDHTVQDCVELLADYGYIVTTGRYTWQIAGSVKQLPFMVEDLPAETVPRDQPGQVIDVDAQKNEPEEISSHNMRPNPSSSSSGLIDLETQESRLDPPPPASKASSHFLRADNLAELDAQGIREPARSKLAGLEHVTPELIRGHCRTAKNTGQAIYRIENNWRAPAIQEGLPNPPWVEPEEIEVDEQAETWWQEMTARLRDHVPRADHAMFLECPQVARQVGQRLEVRVINHLAEEILHRYLGPPELEQMVMEISGGSATAIKFVTRWDE